MSLAKYYECPTCYSDRRGAVVQCSKCNHMVCNKCVQKKTGFFNLWNCPKCGSKKMDKVGIIT